MIHIKNYRHPDYKTGGTFGILYNMEIVNPSPALSEGNVPVYKNTASFYAQEIPNCPTGTPGCTDIQVEKTTLEDVNGGKCTTNARIYEGTIGAIVDTYALVSFTKVDDNNKPLQGAQFSIYKCDKDGKKGSLATNKDGVQLKSLVTNKQGKLCGTDNKPVSLQLARGYYLAEEEQAPQGYMKSEQGKVFTVGYLQQDLIVKNTPTKKPTPVPPAPTPTPEPPAPKPTPVPTPTPEPPAPKPTPVPTPTPVPPAPKQEPKPTPVPPAPKPEPKPTPVPPAPTPTPTPQPTPKPPVPVEPSLAKQPKAIPQTGDNSLSVPATVATILFAAVNLFVGGLCVLHRKLH